MYRDLPGAGMPPEKFAGYLAFIIKKVIIKSIT